MSRWPCPHCGQPVVDYDDDGVGWCVKRSDGSGGHGLVRTDEIIAKVAALYEC